MDLEVDHCSNSEDTYVITDLSYAGSEQITVNGIVNSRTFQNARKVSTQDKRLIRFPRGIGSVFPFVQELFLINCSIDKISRHDFADLNHLIELNLSENCIVELPGDVFNDLRLLKVLILTSNKIRFVNVNLFDALISLELLNLLENSRISKKREKIDFAGGRRAMILDIAGALKLPDTAASIVAQQSKRF